MKFSIAFKQNNILFIILLGGLFLRLYGITFGLPFLYHPDELWMVERALQFGTGDLNPRFFDWPANVIMYLLFGIYGFYYLLLRTIGGIHSPIEFSLMFWNDPTVFYLIARLLTAILSTGTIYLTYKIALESYTKLEGIVAATLMAVSFHYVRDSHYATSDIPLVFCLLLSIKFFVGYSKDGNWKELIYASIFWGLATAVKYPGALLFFTLFVSVGIRSENRQNLFLSRYLK